jgi:hypothetical protein
MNSKKTGQPIRANDRCMGEWREGVGVEPTRDVYSPIPDLKSGGITGCLTLPGAECWYSVWEQASRADVICPQARLTSRSLLC